MYLKKNLFVLLVAFLLVVASCKNDKSTSKESTLNDKESLSTELVNNPTSIDTNEVDMTQTGLLVFEDTVHDFGSLKEGEIIQHDFEYTNKGSKEVIITSAKGSCGCTVPEFDTEPIAPGEKGTMKVTFNSDGKPGYNEKNVQISTNGIPSKYRLTILAKVEKKK